MTRGRSRLRSFLAFIVLLVAGKFGYQDYVYRSALADSLITTYRQDAVESCRKEATARNLAVAYEAWATPDSFQLVVGHGARPASLLDFAGEAASPYLVIVARKDPAKIQCEFDIVRMSAAVTQL